VVVIQVKHAPHPAQIYAQGLFYRCVAIRAEEFLLVASRPLEGSNEVATTLTHFGISGQFTQY
jgi:hypothetical protein